MAYGVADLNGYTAVNEVDTGDLYALSADVTITESDSQSTINSKLNDSNNTVIDVAPGNYGSTRWTITQSGSSASNRRILRLQGSSVTNPYHLLTAQKAVIRGLDMTGSRWFIHRLDFDGNNTNNNIVTITATDVCFDNVRMQRASANAGQSKRQFLPTSCTRVIVQNSVMDNNDVAEGMEVEPYGNEGTNTDCGLVNCEMVDTGKGVEMKGSAPGGFVENCDMWVRCTRYTNGSGTYTKTGSYMAAKSVGISNKCSGTPLNPMDQFKNRIWGGRRTDKTEYGLSTAQGNFGSFSNNNGDTNRTQYVRWRNNIAFDCQEGINQKVNADNNSIYGNLVYRVTNRISGEESDVWKFLGTSVPSNPSSTIRAQEYYLNKIIKCDSWARIASSAQNFDCRGQMLVLCGDASQKSPGAGTQIDYNAYYGSTLYTNQSPGSNIDIAITERNNSTQYAAGDLLVIPDAVGTDGACSDHSGPTYTFTSASVDLTNAAIIKITDTGNSGNGMPEEYTVVSVNSSSSVELSADPTDGNNETGLNFTVIQGCIYRVMNSGTRTTASSLPELTKQLGSYTVDGTAVLRCIMSPYKFYRKLQTGPIVSGSLRGELYSIPYALHYIQNVDANNFVPTGTEPNAIGSRTGIGVDNTQPPNSPFDKDIRGQTRTNTAGGMEPVSCNQPTNFAISGTSNQRVDVTFSLEAGQTANVYWSTSAGTTVIDAMLAGDYLTGQTSPVSITGLTNQVPIYIVLTAQDGVSESTKTTPELSATPDSPEGEEGSPPAGTVTIGTIDGSAGTSADVPYSYSGSDADSFEYQLNNGGFINIGTDNPFTISDLTAGQTYNNPGVEMRAVNSDGTGSISSPKTFSTASVDLCPNVEGLSKSAAQSAIEGNGYIYDEEYQDSLYVARDTVISQSPTGESPLTLGETITVTLSSGEADVVFRGRLRVS